MLHTHSFTYHPHFLMFLSQYFSFPLSVPFHQCPIYSSSSTCCSYQKDKRVKPGILQTCPFGIRGAMDSKVSPYEVSENTKAQPGNIHKFGFPCSNMTANSVATPAVNRRNGTRMQHRNGTRTPPAHAGEFRWNTHTHTHRLARLLHTTVTTPATNTTEVPSYDDRIS